MTTMQDTGKFRSNTTDQFYTCAVVAAACVERILTVWPDAAGWQWVEPSAGTGVFMDAASARGVGSIVGVDVDPRSSAITKADFLEWVPPVTGDRVLLFGNPPFGRQGALAKRFVRHGATFADRIAFILPRSFVKPSMSCAFPPLFHCVFSEELPPRSFLVNGEPHDVPCVFQLWERRDAPRVVVAAAAAAGFTYVKHTEAHQLVIRRVGVRAGAAFVAGTGNFSPQSHYFVLLDRPDVADIAARLTAHPFPSNTTGPRSLSKGEINEVLGALLAT